MSIASEIQRLWNAKNAIKDAIEGKGVTVPDATKLDGYASLINSIQPTIVPFAIRPDAKLVKTWSYDTKIVEDEGITIPEYTTTSKTLKSAWNLSPTYTINYNTYDYLIVEYFLTIPEYNITTVAKGRQEFATNVYVYELAEHHTRTCEPKQVYHGKNSTNYWCAGDKLGLLFWGFDIISSQCILWCVSDRTDTEP